MDFDSKPLFSKRHGYATDRQVPITVRYEAPPFVREGVLAIARKCGFPPDRLRTIICSILDELPDSGQNWSAPNIMQECEGLIRHCEWFEVYDVCEELYREAAEHGGEYAPDYVENSFNRFFLKKGVGWKMLNGQLAIRGEENYEKITTEAIQILKESNRTAAAAELSEGMSDLSRRPEPDITGAIQHSMAALECFVRDVCSSKQTLGDLINKLNLPIPIDQAVEKLWGFASNQGRHIAEGKRPDLPEAMLTVHLCAVLISYITQRKQ